VKKKAPPVEPEPVVVQTKPKPKPVQQAQPQPQAAPAQQQPAPQQVAEPAPQPAALPPPVGGPPAGDTLVKISPIAGSEIPLDKVPGAVGTVSAADVARNGTGQIQNVLQQQVPGIVLSDTAGSGFRTDVSYRGFDASPIGGRSQALAIYMNGIRINESFGDTVNFDAIPSIAISDIAVAGNNPVFGLNAIGGAISFTMKDGFGFQGATIDASAGSFGRRQIAAEAGAMSGAVAAYAAAEYLEEDGFRDFSAAEVKRMFADVGFKGSEVELHFSFNGAKSLAGVVTAAPVELLALDYGRTFTNPQDTEYEVQMPSLRGSVKATDTLTISGLTYYRRFKQNVLDGNLSEVDECAAGGPNDGLLCLPGDGGGEEVVQDSNGNTVSADLFNGPLGSLERITQDAKSFGTSAQAVEKTNLFGRPNQFLVGVSYDHGKVAYQTSSELGTIGDRFVVTGSGIIVVAPDDLQPRDLVTENDYYGVFFSNTLDVTDQFAVTVGGRYNHATIKLTDLTGDFPELNTTNKYDRFNPMIGATYKFMPGLSVYGGYSEANRAPTAAELGCAEPANPCLIESFLTDDPPLKQVVSHSWEGGLRGEHKSWDQQKITWSLGYFRTLNTDDILNVAATTTGRGFFLNAGDTLRQGVEAAIGYQNERLSVFASYALVDATFQTDLILSAPNTPGAPDCPDTDPGTASCNFVQSGDSLPGIPKHRFKAGIEYWLTPQWKIGSDLVAASDQFFFGDEANNNAKLAGYSRIDLKTSYDLTENVQIYGSIKNLFDKRYGLYGTFFDPVEATEAAEPQGITLTDPRSQTPAQPFAIYGGVKVKF
jgi:iron complex outermembrane recepter protein